MRRLLLVMLWMWTTLLSAQDTAVAGRLFRQSKAEKDPVKSEQLGEEAVRATGKDSLAKTFSPLYNYLGTKYAHKGDYAKALLNFGRVLEIGKRENDSALVAKAQINIANIYLSQGKYGSAVGFYLGALPVVEQANDTVVLATNYLMVAQAYYFLQDYPRSLDYYKKCLAIFEKQHAKVSAAYCYNSMGVIYKETGNNEDALTYLAKTKFIAMEANDSVLLASGLTSLGELYGITGKYEDALNHLRWGITIHEKLGDRKALSESFVIMGNVYRSQAQYGEAIAYYEKALAVAETLGLNDVKKNASKGLADAYAGLGNYQEAVKYLNLYASVKDSLFNTNSSRQVADMQTKYETQKKENENALLLKENEINALEIDRQKARTNILVISLVFLVLAAALVYSRTRLRQRNRLLEEKELRARAVFQAHEQEKVRLSKELHDGLGPLLSLAKMNISALESPGDAKTAAVASEVKELINEGIREVRTISHSLMPSLLSKQGLKPALEEFLAQVETGGQVKTSLEFNVAASLSPETEVNIYRVVQEAVTNIIRHAAATKTIVRLAQQDDALELAVEDDGKGFSAEMLSSGSGNGLTNIHSRADFLKAKFTIDSKPGRGTKLSLLIPLTAYA